MSEKQVIQDVLYLSKQERINDFGIECSDAIIWNEWYVGEEFYQKLTIRNVTNQVLKLKYNLAHKTKSFFMEYPKPVVLSPGLKTVLSIGFRPFSMVTKLLLLLLLLLLRLFLRS